MPITGHTWSVAERKAAKSFARSLGETRLQFARELTNRPTASAEDVVEILVQQKREPAWVAGYFDVKKPDIIKFFRNQRPVKADLRLTSLSKMSADELKNVLGSYFSQVTNLISPNRSRCNLLRHYMTSMQHHSIVHSIGWMQPSCFHCRAGKALQGHF